VPLIKDRIEEEMRDILVTDNILDQITFIIEKVTNQPLEMNNTQLDIDSIAKMVKQIIKKKEHCITYQSLMNQQNIKM
jgi:hypothetical protein